jgi:hypothetical protein
MIINISKNLRFRLFVFAAMASSITACGGGSDSESSSDVSRTDVYTEQAYQRATATVTGLTS